MRMWTMGWAGLLALGWALTASAQAVVPQYTHRGYVGGATFDADDARVAVSSSGGFVSVLDVASGRVLAVRRLLRSNESDFSDMALEGPFFRAHASIAGDDPVFVEWNWVEDQVKEGEPNRDGYLAARSPQGRTAMVDHDGNLRLGRHSVALGARVMDVAFPHRRVVVVWRREAPLELRSARDPETVIATVEGRGMSFDRRRRRVATVDGDHVRIAALPGGEVRTERHGLGLAAKRVVFGPRAWAVVGDDRSELHVDGSEPAAIDGTIEWIGRRTMLVKRGPDLLRIRRNDLSERRMASGADQVWPGERGAVVFRDEEMDRFTLVRRTGGRQRYAPGGEHSVWHVHAAPSGEAVVLAGRFGVQRWTGEGVVDGSCDGEALLSVDWERGEAIGQYNRCTARGSARAWPRNAQAMAATADGRIVFLSDGRFAGRDRPRARVRDLPDAQCEEVGYCAWNARFEAKGELLVIRTNPDWGAERAEDRVIRTRTGHDLLRVPAGQTIVVSADGSRIAVLHGRGGAVHDVGGRELFTFGAARSDDAPDATWPAAFSADGARLAWSPSEGVVEVLDASGAAEQRLDVATRPTFVALTADALAVGTAEQTRVVRGGETRHAPAGVGPTSAVCVDGRFRYLRADLHVGRGPACAGGQAERRGDVFYRKMGGAVRVWHGERVMTLRSIRSGSRITHLAYTPDGRWWSSNAEHPPLALRQGTASLALEGEANAGLLTDVLPASTE